MEKSRIHSDNAPAAVGPYSQAIRVGDFLFTAGQVALDPATSRSRSRPARRSKSARSPAAAWWRSSASPSCRPSAAATETPINYE